MAAKDIPLTESVFYILLAVHCPNHGYGIIQQTAERTKGRMQLGPGTLYTALRTLLDKGWIEVYSRETASRRKTEYLITDRGKEVLSQELVRLQEALDNAKTVQEDSTC